MRLFHGIFLILIAVSLEITKVKSIEIPRKQSMPYWQHVLREFVFKTISSPLEFNTALYIKIFIAPFYGDALPIPSNIDNELLSRGDVYHLSDGASWIFCQEECKDCELCKQQEKSMVKWTLRRLRRFISPESYRYDLQLTLLPQASESFHPELLGAGNYVYLGSREESSSEMMKRRLDTTVSSHPSNVDPRFSHRLQKDQIGNSMKRQIKHSNLHTVENKSEAQSTTEKRATMNKNSFTTEAYTENRTIEGDQHQSLILGIDQSGRSHLIHLQSLNPPQKSGTDETISYENFFQNVFKFFWKNRPMIDKFISHPVKMKNDENNENDEKK